MLSRTLATVMAANHSLERTPPRREMTVGDTQRRRSLACLSSPLVLALQVQARCLQLAADSRPIFILP
jgi:hypothetical protein